MKIKIIDVDKFADVLDIERNIAYGFLRFIADAKLVKTGKRPQPKGKKGKPATLFYIDAGLGERLVAHLDKYLSNIPDVEMNEQPAQEEQSPTEQITEKAEEHIEHNHLGETFMPDSCPACQKLRDETVNQAREAV